MESSPYYHLAIGNCLLIFLPSIVPSLFPTFFVILIVSGVHGGG